YFQSGGWVMLPLIALTIVLWYALGYRYAVLRVARSKYSVRLLLDRYLDGKWRQPRSLVEHALMTAVSRKRLHVAPLRAHLVTDFWPYERELERFQVLIKTIVMIAPLLGLLGTVGGMIETFDSLQDMDLFSQSGGIAGGISQALVTTQFGLAIAIPGLLVNGMLNKRKTDIELQLAQVVDVVEVTDISQQRKKHHAV
ncbi:MAG TPA: MotA/TolQ/ExbB proton channel family protein, partial [Gammaproteobacteria bacterium]|nr:MotA/TolQ/ExbB proton channel family protein [Gammaproteobacteria bacterium]